ncbi:hypothetical protein MHTCC0001_31890 [Flavobacteriaceae bacterium MHTCC 0001]
MGYYGIDMPFKQGDTNDDFLSFLQNEKELKNPFLTDANIKKLESETIKRIRKNSYTYGLLGMFSMAYGCYEFFKMEPRIGVNLYTQMPVISNGAIPFVLGFGCVIGSVYSYLKRNEILVAKVKSKIIEHVMQLRREKSSKRSFFNRAKKKNNHLQSKKKRRK